ncbi:MAG: hypothetical protein JNJ98_15600 [Gemmatimonadetes bacterium]|nr:hypothetical protein [Gemmatimonadota bacterium]
MPAVTAVHDASGFLLSSFRDREGLAMPVRETEARIEQVVAGLRSCDHVRWMSAASAAEQAMEVTRRLHAPEYLAFLADASAATAGDILEPRFAEAGVVPDTPVTPGAYAAALQAVSAAVAAANALTGGDRYAYAVCRPPGHHAGRAFMGGYCYLNNAGAAAQVLRDAGQRVGVVDVDFHHGNGTADVLRHVPDVPFLSLHASTLDAFPYRETTPRGANQQFVAFRAPPSADDYLERLADHLGPFRHLDVIIVSIGYDLVEGDPHGGWHMTPGFFQRLSRLFRETDRPLCFIQEGGYALPQLAACARELALGLA